MRMEYMKAIVMALGEMGVGRGNWEAEERGLSCKDLNKEYRLCQNVLQISPARNLDTLEAFKPDDPSLSNQPFLLSIVTPKKDETDENQLEHSYLQTQYRKEKEDKVRMALEKDEAKISAEKQALKA